MHVYTVLGVPYTCERDAVSSTRESRDQGGCRLGCTPPPTS